MNRDDNRDLPHPPAGDGAEDFGDETVQRVEAVPADEPAGGEQEFRFARSGPDHAPGFSFTVFRSGPEPGAPMPAPPALATWICLFLAWVFLGSKVPFTVFLGIPLDIAALLLATACLARGGVFTGILVMILGTAGSLLVYMVGLFRFLTDGI